jgi:cytochrome c biogenesis protein CcdA
VNELLVGSSILGGFVGGMLALLAPCCITVLLPAYFAATFRNVGTLLRMTFLFGAGIAVVILPIALGLAALGQMFSRYHTILFLVGGVFLLVLGVMTLRGKGFELPFLRAPAFAGRPGASVFALGVFSGAASSCCAPVLIGVLTLTALTSSFPGAMAVALAYVFGMVFPLLVLALLGDRFGWSASRLVRGKTLTLDVVGRRFAVHSTNLIGGVLFLVMGVFVLILASTGNEFLAVPGQAELGAQLQVLGDRLIAALSGIPNLAVAGALIALVVLLWRRSAGRSRPTSVEVPDDRP